MSYPAPVHEGDGEVSARLRPASAPADLVFTTGVQVHHLALGAQTRGELGLYRWDFSAERTGPDPHFHRSISESFFVLSGTVSLYDGERWRDGTAGDFLHVPPGGIHGFRNESGAAASMLLLFTPGAPREEYFARLAHLDEQPFTDEDDRARFLLRHDMFPA